MTTLIEAIRRAIAGHVGLAFDDAPPNRRSYIDQRIERPEWTCNTVTQEDLTDAAQAALTALQESGYVVVPSKANRDLFDAWNEAAWPSGEVIYADEFVGPEAQFDAAYRAMLSAAQGEG